MLLEVFCVNFTGAWGLRKNLEKRGKKNKCVREEKNFAQKLWSYDENSNSKFHMLQDFDKYLLTTGTNQMKFRMTWRPFAQLAPPRCPWNIFLTQYFFVWLFCCKYH